MPFFGVSVERDRHRIEVAGRHRLVLEVAAGVLASDERGAVPIGQGLAGVWRDVADRHRDAAVVAAVGIRGVRDPVREEGCLASADLDR